MKISNQAETALARIAAVETELREKRERLPPLGVERDRILSELADQTDVDPKIQKRLAAVRDQVEAIELRIARLGGQLATAREAIPALLESLAGEQAAADADLVKQFDGRYNAALSDFGHVVQQGLELSRRLCTRSLVNRLTMRLRNLNVPPAEGGHSRGLQGRFIMALIRGKPIEIPDDYRELGELRQKLESAMAIREIVA
jgi:hypothetical protein